MTAEHPNEAAATEDFEFAALRHARNYRAALIQEFSPFLEGRVLEVGAGVGHLTAGLLQLPSINRLLCLEPDAGFCRAFRGAFPGQELIQGTIAQVPADTSWNAILNINVLEHIREDAEELAVYRKVLAPAQGRLCLFVPARPEIYAPIDRDFGHHRRYTRRGLRDLLETAGFHIERLNYFNCVGYLAWWFTFCLRRQRGFSESAVRFYDRAIFPPVHWCESRLCRPPIGQSLIAVGRARS